MINPQNFPTLSIHPLETPVVVRQLWCRRASSRTRLDTIAASYSGPSRATQRETSGKPRGSKERLHALKRACPWHAYAHVHDPHAHISSLLNRRLAHRTLICPRAGAHADAHAPCSTLDVWCLAAIPRTKDPLQVAICCGRDATTTTHTAPPSGAGIGSINSGT
eukprot:scaffold49693_cov32-Tisochrysis_lutea.AAC.1